MTVSSMISWSGMLPMIGGSLMGLTVRVKTALELAPLVSVTVTVMDEDPEAFAAGTARNERFAPVPVITRLGISTESAAMALRTRVSSGESSKTVNGISIGVSSDVV